MFDVEIDHLFGVRPKRGERRLHGMLVKMTRAVVDDMAEAEREIAAARDLCEPGYSRVIEVRIRPRVARQYGEAGPAPVRVLDAEEVSALVAPPVDRQPKVAAAPVEHDRQLDLFCA